MFFLFFIYRAIQEQGVTFPDSILHQVTPMEVVHPQVVLMQGHMVVRFVPGVHNMVVHQEDSMEDLMVGTVEVLELLMEVVKPLELLTEVVKPQDPLMEDTSSLRVGHMASIFLEVRTLRLSAYKTTD